MVMCDGEEGYVDPLTDDMKYEEKYVKAIALFTSLKRSLEPTTTKVEETSAIANDAISRLIQQQSEFFQNFSVSGAVAPATQAVAVAPVRDNELPKIQIKQFGGDYKEWPAFKDIYESTIHNKQYLSKTQKFHYLKTFLTADAANLIRHISITEAAYDTAWARLNERYNRPRHIINSLLNTFMTLPTTMKLDVSVLRKVTDGANEVIRGLDAIGEASRDCWIIYMILEKIDIETRRKWVEESRGDSSPTVEELFKFLDARCEEFELSQRNVEALPRAVTQNDNKSKQAYRTFITTDQGNCLNCNALDHNLYRCSEFLNMSEDQRRAFVKDKSLCFNCLKHGHLSHGCGSKFCCKRCNGRHHTSIHSEGATLQTTENQSQSTSTTVAGTCDYCRIIDIDKSLQRFWEIEDNTLDTHQDPENEKVEQHFLNTHTRDTNGRYIVELPFKTPNVKFADTLKGALARFTAVERRLQRDANLQSRYVQFMQDYIRLGHMKEVRPDKDSIASGQIFYMPHHPVIGQKLRIVFDGSYEDCTGRALNDELHIGPSLQRNLFAVCLRFRMHKFVFSADIVKMFRQIWVNAHHRNYQRIVWRETPLSPLRHYQLCTVTYGTACAPFLAGRVPEQLATDYKEEFPDAANILLNDFYVDDVLTGANTERELLRLRDELIHLLACGQLELAKWASNSKYISDNDIIQSQHILDIGQDASIKVLGIHWHPADDSLSYKVTLPLNPKSTRRQVLSDVSRIFDPLGLLAPVVVQFKILFQELWLHDLSWDSELPTNLADLWRKYRADLLDLEHLKLPRFADNNLEDIELHAFSDASTKAYAAVIYSRLVHKDGTISISLIAAKTRVAPLKQQTLPRLELCGALLLSRLIRSIKASLCHKKITIYAWCDATIVLSWLSHPPSKLKTFVGNRTAEILEVVPLNAWYHVNTKDNPADCASRGMLASNLISHDLWWKGPSWLHDKGLYRTMLHNSRSTC